MLVCISVSAAFLPFPFFLNVNLQLLVGINRHLIAAVLMMNVLAKLSNNNQQCE